MTILSITTLTTLIGVISVLGQSGAVQLVIELPNLLDKLMELNNSVFGYGSAKSRSHSGTVESSEEKQNENDEANTDHRKYDQTGLNPREMDYLQVTFQGLHNIAAALKELRRANIKHGLGEKSGLDKIFEHEKLGVNTLTSLIELNKKRNELIREFNNKFPGIFDSSNGRRYYDEIEEPRVRVASTQGAMKVDPVYYPKNYLKRKFRHMLKMKKKQEEQEKRG